MLKHRAILKSIISFKNDKTELEYLLANFNLVHSTNIEFSLSLHDKLYLYVADHCSKFVEVPSSDRVKKHFEEDSEIIEEFEKITKEPTLQGSNFKSLVSEVFEEQQKKKLITILKDASQISETGKKIKNEFVTGPKKAVEYILYNSLDILKPEIKVRNQGETKGNTKEALTEYFEVKSSNKFDGLLTGLETVDSCCKGLRPGELWLIVAYVSELKSTLTMNFAYTQAIEQKKNIKFVTLEMPYKDVRNIFVCIHSANLNLWPGSEWEDVYPLNWEGITDGTLSEREEEFFNFLCHDLDTNPEYGNISIYRPSDALTMSHLKAWADVEYRKEPFDALYLDYIELMKDEVKGKDYTIDLNQRIKDLKQFALNFNDGKGLRVASAYQANRKGKEHADKHDGEYRLDALSYANEAERSADVIMYSYLNDTLRAEDHAKIGCLKNRSRSKFKQFIANTILSCRKVYELPSDMISDENNIEKKVEDSKKKKKTQEELIADL